MRVTLRRLARLLKAASVVGVLSCGEGGESGDGIYDASTGGTSPGAAGGSAGGTSGDASTGGASSGAGGTSGDVSTGGASSGAGNVSTGGDSSGEDGGSAGGDSSGEDGGSSGGASPGANGGSAGGDSSGEDGGSSGGASPGADGGSAGEIVLEPSDGGQPGDEVTPGCGDLCACLADTAGDDESDCELACLALLETGDAALACTELLTGLGEPYDGCLEHCDDL